MKINKLEDLLRIENNKKRKLAVVACHDGEVLEAIVESESYGLIEPILIGNKTLTKKIAKELLLDIDRFSIIDEQDLEKAAELGVKLVSSGKADFIMKGLIDTSTLLKAVLNKEWGLRTETLLSHVMVYEIPNYPKLVYLTDGGMNINPSIEDKVKIIENAGIVAKSLGNEIVRVALLAASERVDEKMIATVHGSELKAKYLKGDFSQGLIIDGPMGLDLAISKESVKVKDYYSEVAGRADILLVPNIEMGNGIGKSITYFAKGNSAGVIMGAKSPIVLTSRSDDHKSKVFSIGLGCVISRGTV